MPIYEYECDACGNIDELLQKFDSLPPAQCSKCNKEGTLHKLISHSSFALKGGGWYSDLYSSKKPSCETKSEGKSEGCGSGGCKN